MPRSLIFLLLGGILLAQYGQLTVATESSSSEESNENNAASTPRIELLTFAVRKFSMLFVNALDSRAVISKVLLESENSHLDKELEAQLSRLSKYSDEVSALLLQDRQLRDRVAEEPAFPDSEEGRQLLTEFLKRYFKLTSEFADIVDQYKSTMEKPEEQQLQQSLQRNGFEKLSTQFAEVFAGFRPKFNFAMEKYIAGLTAEEREKDAELIKWYEQFKSDRKLQNFVAFVGFFSVQEISECSIIIKNRKRT